MSTIIDGDGPAFPTFFIEPKFGSGYKGMTLRDYFAGQAIAGIIACPQVRHDMFDAYARHAYSQADAMLVYRKRKEDDK